jgi:hypothetical protein
MKRVLGIVAFCLCLAVPGLAAQNPPDKPAGRAELLTNGRITKIDNKKMTLTVRNEAEGVTYPRDPQREPRTGGGGYPGRRRRGGVGFPGGGRFPEPGGGRRPPQSTTKDQGKEYKVYVTDDTAISDADKRLSFSNLVVGDRITIQGLPKGKGADLEASKITLNH